MKALTATAAVLAALAVVPAAASAQTSPQAYGSVGYSHQDYDDQKLGNVQVRGGLRFGRHLGAEVELGAGVKGDETNVAGVDIDTKVNHEAAIYGVGFLPVSENADLFARIGYGTTEIEVEGAGATARGDGASWNYGVGGQYFFDDKNGLRADYTRKDFDDADLEVDAWSVGYVRKF
jgi:outer membrane immunogenic protein